MNLLVILLLLKCGEEMSFMITFDEQLSGIRSVPLLSVYTSPQCISLVNYMNPVNLVDYTSLYKLVAVDESLVNKSHAYATSLSNIISPDFSDNFNYRVKYHTV